MKKRLVLLVIAVMMAAQAFGQAKYVFLFIGDGMGANQVNLTEQYLGATEGHLGYGKLCFASFPVASVATTFSANNNVTDSAASGTAIACGVKTENAVLGLDAEGNRLTSIAEMAKRSGKKVGIISTVAVNEATPAAFFGHQGNRKMYDPLFMDMLAADFDFYAGSNIGREKNSTLDNEALLTEAGYTMVGSVDEFKEKCASAGKMIMIPDGRHSVRYAIDREYKVGKTSTSLKEMVESSVAFLTKDKKSNGFFIMAEGGKIDGSCHGNDAMTAIKEVIDMDEAIKVAYEFYLKHPKETAIIVTADHETGGIVVRDSHYSQLANLGIQKQSEGSVTGELKDMMKQKGKTPLTWEEVKAFLSEKLGLWSEIKVKPADELALFQIYIDTIAKNEAGNKSDEFGYNHDASIVSAAVDIFDKYCGVHWACTGHTCGYVPVYAIGVGQEKFQEKLDNTQIAHKIKELARYR